MTFASVTEPAPPPTPSSNATRRLSSVVFQLRLPMNNRVPGAAMTTVHGRGRDSGQGEGGAEAALCPWPERGRKGSVVWAADGAGGGDEGVGAKRRDTDTVHREGGRWKHKQQTAPIYAWGARPMLSNRPRPQPPPPRVAHSPSPSPRWSCQGHRNRRGRRRGGAYANLLPLWRAARAQGPPSGPRGRQRTVCRNGARQGGPCRAPDGSSSPARGVGGHTLDGRWHIRDGRWRT